MSLSFPFEFLTSAPTPSQLGMAELYSESEILEVWFLVEIQEDPEPMENSDVEESVVAYYYSPFSSLPRNPRTEEMVQQEEVPTATHYSPSYNTPTTTSYPAPLSPIIIVPGVIVMMVVMVFIITVVRFISPLILILIICCICIQVVCGWVFPGRVIKGTHYYVAFLLT